MTLLAGPYFGCLRTLFAFGGLVLYLLPVLKRTEAVRVNAGMMHEQVITAIVRGNKPKSLLIIKPFYRSCRHFSFSYVLTMDSIFSPSTYVKTKQGARPREGIRDYFSPFRLVVDHIVGIFANKIAKFVRLWKAGRNALLAKIALKLLPCKALYNILNFGCMLDFASRLRFRSEFCYFDVLRSSKGPRIDGKYAKREQRL